MTYNPTTDARCGAVLLAVALAISGGCATVTPPSPPRIWPLPPDPPRIEFVGQLTSSGDVGVKPSLFRRLLGLVTGEKSIALVRPTAVFSDGRGKIFVTDTGLQVVHLFDMNKKEYRQIFHLTGSARLISPVGVALDDRGRIYVSDSVLNDIFLFDAEGRLLGRIGQPGDFERVAGIAIGPDRQLYAADAGGHKVVVYAPDGHKVKTIGKRGGAPGEFNFPTQVAVDRNGTIYVTDSLNFRIQLFNRDGTFLRMFGHAGTRIGTFSKPKGVAVDTDGDIFVVDGIYDVVQIFDQRGQLLLHVGGGGSDVGRFWLPTGIAIDQQNRIYVADTYNHRVQIFQLLQIAAEK